MCARAPEILKGYSQVERALPELRLACGYIQLTSSALRRAMGARQMGSPSDYLFGGTPPPVQSSVPAPARPVAVTQETRRAQRILVCPDAHHPFVDPVAWECFLAAARHMKPDVLVIIGDFCDAFAVSSHSKHPSRRIGFATELAATNKALDQIEALGIPRVVYTEGNHENRLDRYIADKAPEMFGVVPGMKGLLRVHERAGWEWYPYKELVRIGSMSFCHDAGFCGVNAARASLQATGANFCFGHTHRLGVVYEGTVEDGMRVCMNVGWLGNVQDVDYMHKWRAQRDWQQGFGFVDQDSEGLSWCQTVPILRGRCMIDGVRIAA